MDKQEFNTKKDNPLKIKKEFNTCKQILKINTQSVEDNKKIS